jgi:hypothetical protein
LNPNKSSNFFHWDDQSNIFVVDHYSYIIYLIIFLAQIGRIDMTSNQKLSAERFIRGVYGGDPSVVGELANEDVMVSYPIFEKLFDTPAIRGQEAVKKFAVRFGKRWIDGQIMIHLAVEEGNTVVLMWSFRAIRADMGQPDGTPAGQESSWGGISIIRFDSEGKIMAEIGEESTPGPFARTEGN